MYRYRIEIFYLHFNRDGISLMTATNKILCRTDIIVFTTLLTVVLLTQNLSARSKSLQLSFNFI